MEYNQALGDFIDAMAAAGLSIIDEVLADGKLHRFYVDGDSRGTENGWYILHIDDRPAGCFGSWKTGEKHTWTAKVDRKLSQADRLALEKKITEQKRVQEAEMAAVQAESASRAETIWAESTPAQPEHAYLSRKGIRPIGARVSGDALIIPARSPEGKLTTLQFISAMGEKRFLSGGRIQGCYTTLAAGAPNPLGPIAICEGYATAASIHAATEWPVVIAFNAGNLEPVAIAIRTKFPQAKIILAADNDQWTKRPILNPGLHYATLAASKVGAAVVAPAFKHASETNKITDWNDLAGSEGLPVVGAQLEAALLQKVTPIDVTASVNSMVTFGDSEDQALALADSTVPERGFKYNVFDWPVMGGRGKPLSCIENVDHLLKLNRISVRYDVIRKDVSIIIPGENYLIDTEKNDKMTRIVSIASTASLPGGRVEDFVAHIASQNPYNPVSEWILSAKWDGQSRLADFYATVEAQGDEEESRRLFKETILKRWMISAVAAAFRPNGVSAHGILVFKGDQYIGKTNWFKRLVPQELKLTRDGMLLDPKDKDSVYQIVSSWLVELGEIDATFRKSDIAQLKAFITKDQDTIRLPYARFPASFARRTVFFASVNEGEYLSDPTGNRRFWTVDCKSLNHNHSLNMQQVWAEFYEMYQAGEGWYLAADEMQALNNHNRDYESVSAVEEMIGLMLAWDDPKSLWKPRTATEIAMAIGIKDLSEKQLKQIGRAVREKTGEGRSRSNGRYVYHVPGIRILPE